MTTLIKSLLYTRAFASCNRIGETHDYSKVKESHIITWPRQLGKCQRLNSSWSATAARVCASFLFFSFSLLSSSVRLLWGDDDDDRECFECH